MCLSEYYRPSFDSMNMILKIVVLSILLSFVLVDYTYGQEPLPENPLTLSEQEFSSFRKADGPAGVRLGESTAYPVPIGLAATWDTSLVYQVGRAIAIEAKTRDIDVLFAPFLNILRHPLSGRNFESYGEDPYLAGQIAAAFINGVQSQDLMACVKHFTCNNQEWEKHDLNVVASERALREIYLPAFKAAVQQGNAGCVMTAYNSVNYAACDENTHLLNEILKDEWNFDGFIVPGQIGTESLTSKATDTLDIEMMDQLALQAARKSIVLLKNQGGLLPLDPDEIASIALIGPNTFEARVGGGGSSQVTPRHAVSPIKGIQNLLGDKVSISSTYGIAAYGDIIPLRSESMRPYYPHNKYPGLKADYYANTELSGTPDFTRVDSIINFVWGYDSPHAELAAANDNHDFSVRWTGKLIPPANGLFKLNVLCNGGCRLYVNDELLIDDWEGKFGELRSAGYSFETGNEYDVTLEYRFTAGIANIKFGWHLPDEDLISAAVYHARNADIAIVFAGLSNRFESEGYDRKTLDLPNQDKLIKAVLKANPNTIVVMQTGAQVVMEAWIREVPAVLQAWYPGQEGGNAIAEVIFGKYNPTGRLPFTIAWNERDYPSLKGYQNPNLMGDYHEGIYVGYRYFDKEQVKPLFPFGHGLSYTTIGIGKLLIQRSSGKYNYYASIEMTNMDDEKGSELLQLYIHPVDSEIDRPEKELRRFKWITLEAGERIVVKIPFNRSDFAFFNEKTNLWKIEPGLYDVLIGTSAGNIKLSKRIEIK